MNTTASNMTYAEAACAALREAMQADPNVIALGEDLGRGGVFGQYRGLQQEFGADRIIDTPISESNIMGSAVGMALAGVRPIVEMRVIDFASGLAYGLEGGMKQIADKVFVVTPRNVEFSAEQRAELIEKGFFNQS